MSSTPRFLSPFRICSQYFALLFSPMYIPSTSFLPPITQLTIKLRFKSVFENFAYHLLKKRSQVMQIVNFKRCDKNFLSLSFLSCFAARTSGLSLYFGMIIPPNCYFYDTPFRRFTQVLKRSHKSNYLRNRSHHTLYYCSILWLHKIQRWSINNALQVYINFKAKSHKAITSID